MNTPLIIFEWSGEAMVPLPRFAKLCDAEFVVHERYKMEAVEERSMVSHQHFFASLHESWKNLPEGLAEAFPTPEHLRKYALIKSGFHHEQSFVCESEAQAQRLATFLIPMDEFAVVTVKGKVVVKYTAQSQDMRSMKKEKFQQSKNAVLELVSAMIGVAKQDLEDEAQIADQGSHRV